MKFQILWVGSNADAEFGEAVERYRKRIAHFFPIEVIEVVPEKKRQNKSDQAIIRAESERLLAAVPHRGTVVVVDQRGEAYDSLRFSKWIEKLSIHEPNELSFVLGGDLGLDDEVRTRADKLLSLSAMTLPHQIARVVLLEQIYRACTLIRNISYHK
ncbi:MAG TPA: 23S rRNA (pseudouridine(1915)-N(3))-methyltransferase RlmH [Thermoanaerobaculia bacterium]|nr:23S rRNA (pseudouridine(1915)-N(3))-methyltransferase RlmH [Thermoanaerobaculia bacterium]